MAAMGEALDLERMRADVARVLECTPAEIGDDDPEVAERRVLELLARLPAEVPARRVSDPIAVQLIWRLRDCGLAATARPPGHQPPPRGREDAAATPARLREYLPPTPAPRATRCRCARR